MDSARSRWPKRVTDLPEMARQRRLNGRKEEKKTTLRPELHYSHLFEQWYDLPPEAHGIFVIREEAHEHAIHAQFVESLQFESHLFSRADDWQSTSTKSEHLQGKL